MMILGELSTDASQKSTLLQFHFLWKFSNWSTIRPICNKPAWVSNLFMFIAVLAFEVRSVASVEFDKDTTPEQVLSDESVMDKLMAALQEASANVRLRRVSIAPMLAQERRRHQFLNQQAAYDLSSDIRLLRKAAEVGEMLLVAFDTPNRMPVTRWF
jgi:hypothetical protein